jgi:hypothetical protein
MTHILNIQPTQLKTQLRVSLSFLYCIDRLLDAGDAHDDGTTPASIS